MSSGLLPPVGSEVLVTINGQTASLRTRKLTRSQGSRFIVVREGDENRKGQILLSSVTTKWSGWLPTKEIRIRREEGE